MSASNFRDLLHVNNDTVDKPQALADGHYIGIIKGHEFGRSRQKQTPQVSIILSPTEESSDIPETANCKKDGNKIDLSQIEVRKVFYLTPRSIYRLGQFLDAVLGPDSRYFDERLPETRGIRVMFQATHRDNEDGTPSDFNDVGTVVAVS